MSQPHRIQLGWLLGIVFLSTIMAWLTVGGILKLTPISSVVVGWPTGLLTKHLDPRGFDGEQPYVLELSDGDFSSAALDRFGRSATVDPSDTSTHRIVYAVVLDLLVHCDVDAVVMCEDFRHDSVYSLEFVSAVQRARAAGVNVVIGTSGKLSEMDTRLASEFPRGSIGSLDLLYGNEMINAPLYSFGGTGAERSHIIVGAVAAAHDGVLVPELRRRSSEWVIYLVDVANGSSGVQLTLRGARQLRTLRMPQPELFVTSDLGQHQSSIPVVDLAYLAGHSVSELRSELAGRVVFVGHGRLSPFTYAHGMNHAIAHAAVYRDILFGQTLIQIHSGFQISMILGLLVGAVAGVLVVQQETLSRLLRVLSRALRASLRKMGFQGAVVFVPPRDGLLDDLLKAALNPTGLLVLRWFVLVLAFGAVGTVCASWVYILQAFCILSFQCFFPFQSQVPLALDIRSGDPDKRSLPS